MPRVSANPTALVQACTSCHFRYCWPGSRLAYTWRTCLHAYLHVAMSALNRNDQAIANLQVQRLTTAMVALHQSTQQGGQQQLAAQQQPGQQRPGSAPPGSSGMPAGQLQAPPHQVGCCGVDAHSLNAKSRQFHCVKGVGAAAAHLCPYRLLQLAGRGSLTKWAILWCLRGPMPAVNWWHLGQRWLPWKWQKPPWPASLNCCTPPVPWQTSSCTLTASSARPAAHAAAQRETGAWLHRGRDGTPGATRLHALGWQPGSQQAAIPQPRPWQATLSQSHSWQAALPQPSAWQAALARRAAPTRAPGVSCWALGQHAAVCSSPWSSRRTLAAAVCIPAGRTEAGSSICCDHTWHSASQWCNACQGWPKSSGLPLTPTR